MLSKYISLATQTHKQANPKSKERLSACLMVDNGKIEREKNENVQGFYLACISNYCSLGFLTKPSITSNYLQVHLLSTKHDKENLPGVDQNTIIRVWILYIHVDISVYIYMK